MEEKDSVHHLRLYAKIYKDSFRVIKDAIEFSQKKQLLPIFSRDLKLKKGQSVGKKNFLVTGYQEFWYKYLSLKPVDRNFYEIIVPWLPCRLHIDSEVVYQFNPDFMPDQTEKLFFEKLTTLMLNLHIIEDPNQEMKLFTLNSSNEKKYSKHFIIHLQQKIFKNNYHVGALMRRLVQMVNDEMGQPHVGHPLYFVDQLPSKGKVLRFFADMSIYTMNRNFRIYGSSKRDGIYRPLLPDDEKRSHNERSDIPLQMSTFFDTLIQFTDAEANYTKVLECTELDDSIPDSQGNRNLVTLDDEGIKLTKAPSRIQRMKEFENKPEKNHTKDSIFTEVIPKQNHSDVKDYPIRYGLLELVGSVPIKMSMSPYTNRFRIAKDSALSIIQRSLRRKNEDLALIFSAELYLSGCAPMLWNRLEVSSVQDFSLACPKLAEVVRMGRKRWEILYKTNRDGDSDDARLLTMSVVSFMCRLRTSLIVHCASIVSMKQGETGYRYSSFREGKGTTVDTLLKTRIQRLIGKQHEEFQTLIVSLVQNIFDKRPREACYFAEQIYMREPQKPNEFLSPIDIPKKKDGVKYMDLLWSTILLCCNDQQRPRITAIREIYRTYAKEENCYSERYFLHHAVLCLVYGVVFKDVECDIPEVSIETLNKIFREDLERPELPDWALNKQNYALEYLWIEDSDETTSLREIDNIFLNEAKEICTRIMKTLGNRAAKVKLIRKGIRYKDVETAVKFVGGVIQTNNGMDKECNDVSNALNRIELDDNKTVSSNESRDPVLEDSMEVTSTENYSKEETTVEKKTHRKKVKQTKQDEDGVAEGGWIKKKKKMRLRVVSKKNDTRSAESLEKDVDDFLFKDPISSIAQAKQERDTAKRVTLKKKLTSASLVSVVLEQKEEDDFLDKDPVMVPRIEIKKKGYSRDVIPSGTEFIIHDDHKFIVTDSLLMEIPQLNSSGKKRHVAVYAEININFNEEYSTEEPTAEKTELSVILTGPLSHHQAVSCLLINELKAFVGIDTIPYTEVEECTSRSMYILCRDLGYGLKKYKTKEVDLEQTGDRILVVESVSTGFARLDELMEHNQSRIKVVHLFKMSLILSFRFILGIYDDPTQNIYISQKNDHIITLMSPRSNKLGKKLSFGNSEAKVDLMDFFFSPFNIQNQEFYTRFSSYIESRKEILLNMLSKWVLILDLFRDIFVKYHLENYYDQEFKSYMLGQLNTLILCIKHSYT